MDRQKIEQLDNALLSASKNVRVLSTLAWPGGVEEKFLEGWHKGKAQLPTIHIQSPDLRQSVSILNAIVQKCDQKDPVEKFLAETALSYAHAGNMLMNVGTTEFTRYSSLIYGRPDTVYKNQGFSGVDSAKFFLEITDKLKDNLYEFGFEQCEKKRNESSKIFDLKWEKSKFYRAEFR